MSGKEELVSVCPLQLERKRTHNLLDNFRGSVEVDQALVDLELELVPCFGTLTARL
jgi:hypothetical protein